MFLSTDVLRMSMLSHGEHALSSASETYCRAMGVLEAQDEHTWRLSCLALPGKKNASQSHVSARRHGSWCLGSPDRYLRQTEAIPRTDILPPGRSISSMPDPVQNHSHDDSSEVARATADRISCTTRQGSQDIATCPQLQRGRSDVPSSR